jgi:heme-degrading monooxygenase HmoA
MPYMLVQHTVEDYAKWKSAFDRNGANRQAAGSNGGFVLRNAEDGNEMTVLLKFDTLKGARAFATSAELRETMQRAGVVGQPKVTYLEEADRPSR